MKYLLILLLFVSCSDGGGLIGTPTSTTTQTKPDKLPLEPSEKGAQPKPLFAFTYGYLQPVTGLSEQGDNYEALQGLVDSATGRVILPAGTYSYSKPLAWVNKTVVIEGQGIGLTVLRGPGIKISRTHSQARSKISALSLLSSDKSEGTHGIEISALTDLQDVYIKGFGGDGLHYFGDMGTGTDVSGCVAINVEVAECSGNGVYIQGGDANVIAFYSCNTRDNEGQGFYDKSFLGCHFFSCMAHYNKKGDYRSDDPNARSTFNGCYSEGQGIKNYIGGAGRVYGGIYADGWIVKDWAKADYQ